MRLRHKDATHIDEAIALFDNEFGAVIASADNAIERQNYLRRPSINTTADVLQ